MSKIRRFKFFAPYILNGCSRNLFVLNECIQGRLNNERRRKAIKLNIFSYLEANVLYILTLLLFTDCRFVIDIIICICKCKLLLRAFHADFIFNSISTIVSIFDNTTHHYKNMGERSSTKKGFMIALFVSLCLIPFCTYDNQKNIKSDSSFICNSIFVLSYKRYR